MVWNAKYAFWINNLTGARVHSPDNFVRILMTRIKDIKIANKIDGRKREMTSRITFEMLLSELSQEIWASCGTHVRNNTNHSNEHSPEDDQGGNDALNGISANDLLPQRNSKRAPDNLVRMHTSIVW
jgi:hypothetical protein